MEKYQFSRRIGIRALFWCRILDYDIMIEGWHYGQTFFEKKFIVSHLAITWSFNLQTQIKYQAGRLVIAGKCRAIIFCYVDGLTILSPAIRGLHCEKMLGVCDEFADEYSVKFNARKPVCTCFSRKPSWNICIPLWIKILQEQSRQAFRQHSVI